MFDLICLSETYLYSSISIEVNIVIIIILLLMVINYFMQQGFPQVFRIWEGCAPPIVGGGSSKFDGGGLSQYMEGAWGSLRWWWEIPVKEFIC